MTQEEKLKALHKKMRMLRLTARTSKRKIARNKRIVHKMLRMTDLLHSYIPDSRWVNIVVASYN